MLHYRFWPGVSACLDDIRAQTDAVERLLIVDNASGDGSVEALAVAYPDVDVLQLPTNDGYAAGMNAALRTLDLSSLDYVLLCTHDVRLEPDCLQELVAVAESDPRIAVAGPLLGWASRPDEVWSAGGVLGPLTGRPAHVREPVLLSDARRGLVTDRVWVDGAAMLVRAEVFEHAGWFDERFFLYSEELEWLRRVGAAGKRIVVVPRAVAWQEPGMAPPYLETRNRILLYRHLKDAWFFLVAIVSGVVAGLRSLRAGRRSEAKLRFLGVIDGLTSRLRREIAMQR